MVSHWRGRCGLGNGVEFPRAFSSYSPSEDKVYGVICISKSNKILLVKGRTNNKWSFPKGHREKNESSIHCALRELYEETGISISSLCVDFSKIPYKKFKVGGYYIVELEDEIIPSPRDTNEIGEAKWMSSDEITECIHNQVANIDIRQFNTFISVCA